MLRLSQGSASALVDYVQRQLENFFPDGATDQRHALDAHIPAALKRLQHTINAVRWWPKDEFDHLHSSQYTIFLYTLASTLWRAGVTRPLATL